MIVPRTGNPEDKPWQITNDLIYNAAVWRNGGGSEETTHICDDCLRIGLRAIKVKVDELLGEIEAGGDKNAELTELTQRVGLMQFYHQSLAYAHDRMQSRLAAVLAILKEHGIAETQEIKHAQWEAARGPARKEEGAYLFVTTPEENAQTLATPRITP